MSNPLFDGLRNLVANLGTRRDKAASATYVGTAITPMEALAMYRTSWLARKIVDIPALDACRNWRAWNGDSGDITSIEALESKLAVRKKLHEAIVAARLYGGAALYISTTDSDPSKPINTERGDTQIRHLVILTRFNLNVGPVETDPDSERFGLPSYYEITGSARAANVKIHPSRLVVFRGATVPASEQLLLTDGWGDPVLSPMVDAIKQADGAAANIASLLYEAKVDVVKIPNLMKNLVDKKYEQLLMERLTLAMTAKGVNGSLILDAEEGYEQKTLQFSGLTDVFMSFMQAVAGAADIPLTRLMGQAPGGLNSTGDSDVRNYYDKVRSLQELEIGTATETLDKLLARIAMPSSYATAYYDWRPLWQPTTTEKADIGNKVATTIKTIVEARVFNDDVLTKLAQNMLAESGAAPGLDAIVDEFGSDEERRDDPISTDPAVIPAPVQTQQPLTEDAKPRTLYVRRDVLNADDIKAWAKEQGFEAIADDLHVTIAYSRTPIDWMKTGDTWASDGELVVPAGGPRAVELFGAVVVVEFANGPLTWRNKQIIEAGASWDWIDYRPHITIAKAADNEALDIESITPYRGRIVLGPEIFEEVKP